MMKEYTYDLHVHSCLSPCGDVDMTPSNIIGMAMIAECDILAITDHNSAKNARAVMQAGEEAGILVIPGMELCVDEEAHIVCLFETIEGAEAFDEYVYAHMPHIKNRAEVFGEQQIRDAQDNIIGLEENLLIVASQIDVSAVMPLAAQFGGTAFPAHVNRDSYSIIASLGMIPPETGFKTAELTYDCDEFQYFKQQPELMDMRILRNSDSHYLETLANPKAKMRLEEKTRRAVIEKIAGGIQKINR